jgi:hypothetical protein
VKVPVTFQPSLGEWFDFWCSSPLERDRIDGLMANDFLCVSNQDYKTQISHSCSSENKSHLYDLRKYISWSIEHEPKVALTLAALAENNEKDAQLALVRKSLNDARAEIQISEPREATFDRKFRILCERAKRIEIFDQYAGVSIGLLDPGAMWFIQTIVRLNPTVTIATYCLDVKDSKRAMPASFNERVAKIRESLVSLIVNEHNFQGELRVTIGPEEKIRMHDRRFSFRFDSGVTNLNVGSGLGIFKSAFSVDSHTVDLSDRSSIQTIRQISEDFSNNRQNGAQFALRHLDICKICPS